ncbi:TonB-dependent receptor [Methylobacillus sp. MM3]|jgi:catecholate siderophore receptor|uniref:TonB-dependent receptor n=1 Tax=Methylobacillus sp. MM3 TaxID=1848039 RepID=UPI0007E1A525|nr:TonB-dependent siderophore receptor [Methylobacillus sp. MM3]OAJ69479.1 TonB-dependent receptor [Methylobacillus sp. MM3]
MKKRMLATALSAVFGINGMAVAETADTRKEHVTLDEVEVIAPAISDTQPVKGYNAKKSTTATKTETELIDVPQSISVVTQELLEDQSVQSMRDAVRYVPGVTSSQGEGNRDALNFRGSGVTTGDFYLDGIRDDVQTYRDFYNVDRIEVLKGPNGMIFGRGAAGGAINRVSKEAGWDPVRELTLSSGAYDHKRAAIDIGDSINDVAAFRLNAVVEDSESYRDGVEVKRHGINPTFTIRPTDRTKIVLGAEYFKDEHIGDRGMPSVNGPGNSRLKTRAYDIGDHETFFGNARLSPNETETVAFNAMIEHAFENGLTIRNRTRYADYDKFYQNVFARGPVLNNGTVDLGAYRDETDRENLINQTDLIYNLKTGSVEHKLLLGMELGKQDTDNMRFLKAGGGESVGFVNAADPTFTGSIAFTNINRNRKSEADITAFYAQDQIVFSPKWQAIIGVRHDKFEVEHTSLPVTGSNTTTKLDATDNMLSPRAGLIFKPINNLSFYGSYSQTYVPRAGDQLDSLNFVKSSLDPEKFINHELGAKWDVSPELSVTAAIYKLKREKAEVVLSATESTLADNQETKGFELGVSGKITSKWSMFGGYTYQDGEITEDILAFNSNGTRNASNDIHKGSELAQTPEHTFSLWNRYDINEMWGVALGVISRSEMYAAVPTATQSTVLPGYTRYDAAIFAKFSEKLRLQVNLENLTNKEYVLDAHNNNNITPGSPFTGRATLIYNF